MGAKITTETHEENKHFKVVLINGVAVGTVMADDKMTAKECYESLKNNWEIDKMEGSHYFELDRLGL